MTAIVTPGFRVGGEVRQLPTVVFEFEREPRRRTNGSCICLLMLCATHMLPRVRRFSIFVQSHGLLVVAACSHKFTCLEAQNLFTMHSTH